MKKKLIILCLVLTLAIGMLIPTAIPAKAVTIEDIKLPSWSHLVSGDLKGVQIEYWTANRGGSFPSQPFYCLYLIYNSLPQYTTQYEPHNSLRFQPNTAAMIYTWKIGETNWSNITSWYGANNFLFLSTTGISRTILLTWNGGEVIPDETKRVPQTHVLNSVTYDVTPVPPPEPPKQYEFDLVHGYNNKIYSNRLLDIASPEYVLAKATFNDINYIKITMGEETLATIPAYLFNSSEEIEILTNKFTGLKKDEINTITFVPYDEDGIEINELDCSRKTIQISFVNSYVPPINPSNPNQPQMPSIVLPNRSDYADDIFGLISYSLDTLTTYIKLPFTFMSNMLNEMTTWMEESMAWITVLTAFFATLFSFLPTPVSGALITLIFIIVIFTILKLIRG